RELVLLELVPDSAQLAERTAALESARASLSVPVRTACFTSSEPGPDLVRFAAEQEAELVAVDTRYPALLDQTPCDVAIVPGRRTFKPDGPILVPFGGAREEWAALEVGAWLARAHGLTLR